MNLVVYIYIEYMSMSDETMVGVDGESDSFVKNSHRAKFESSRRPVQSKL